jgi:HPt (histidine-containing phosphotransfer) domain-containing protein
MDDELAGGDAPLDTDLDPGTLAELRRVAGDAGTVRILELFLETCAADLAMLAAQGEAGNRDAVRRAAHALRGSALAVGATALAVACAAIEQSATAPDPALLAHVMAMARATTAAVARTIVSIR